MPEPDGVDAEQAGGRPGDERVEGERPDVRAVLPEVLALDEALLVTRLLPQRAGVVPAPPGHRLVDRRPEPAELVGRQQVGHHDEAVAPERLDAGAA